MTNQELQGHYQLGFSYEQEGNLVAAEKEYDIVINDRNAEPLLSYKAYKGKLYLNFEKAAVRDNLAAVMTEIFTKFDETREDLYYDLSMYYKATDDHHRLINNLEQLVYRFPNGDHAVDAYLELGLAYQHIKNEIPEAITAYTEYFNRSGKKHPGVQTAALNLAECYNKVGQTAEAKTLLKRYLKIG